MEEAELDAEADEAGALPWVGVETPRQKRLVAFPEPEPPSMWLSPLVLARGEQIESDMDMEEP